MEKNVYLFCQLDEKDCKVMLYKERKAGMRASYVSNNSTSVIAVSCQPVQMLLRESSHQNISVAACENPFCSEL